MSLTTIQADSAVRNPLRVLADPAGTSIGGIVADLAARTLTPEERTAVARRVLTEQFGIGLDDRLAGSGRRTSGRALRAPARPGEPAAVVIGGHKHPGRTRQPPQLPGPSGCNGAGRHGLPHRSGRILLSPANRAGTP